MTAFDVQASPFQRSVSLGLSGFCPTCPTSPEKVGQFLVCMSLFLLCLPNLPNLPNLFPRVCACAGDVRARACAHHPRARRYVCFV